jgi:PAS domain S-box-containing protein
MIWNTGKRRKAAKVREEAMHMKVQESQQMLLAAATSTADAAQDVTARLRHRLDESLRQFEITANILKDGLIVCDRNGRIQSFNNAACLMFGYSAYDALHIAPHTLFMSEFGGMKNVDDLFKTIDKGIPLMGMTRTGDSFPIEASVATLDRYDGSTTVLILVHYLELEELRRDEKRYRSVFEAGCDGIFVVKNDIIAAINPAAARLFGYEVSDLLSRPIADIVKFGGMGGIATAETTGVHHNGREVAMVIQTVPINWDDEEASLITVRSITAAGAPEQDGSIFGGIGDKRMTSGNTTADMIICLDHNFIVTYANRAFCSYFSKDNCIGASLMELFAAPEFSPFIVGLRFLTPETPARRIQFQIDMAHLDTSKRYQDWRCHAEFSHGLAEYQCIGRDLTRSLIAPSNPA